MSEVIMTIGEKIKQRRLELGYTQDKLAKLCGYDSHSTISYIEKDKTNLHKKTLIPICRALSLDPETLEPIAESAWDELQEIHKVYIYASDRLRNDIHFLRDHLYTLSAWEIKYADSLKRLPKR